MGALFQNVCYPDQAAARQSVCSGFVERSVAAPDVWSTSCTSTVFTDPAMSVQVLKNGVLNSSFSSEWPVTPACDFEGGVSLSYDYFLAALAFLCLVWGGKKLIQLFDHSHADS